MIEEASLVEKEEEEEESLLKRLKGLVLSSLLDHNVSWAMFDQQLCVCVCVRVCACVYVCMCERERDSV